MSSASNHSNAVTRRAAAAGAAALIGAGLVPGFARAADDLASGQFRAEVIETLRREHPDWRMESPADPTVLEVEGARAYLGNLYQTLGGATRPEREARIKAFFNVLPSKPGDEGGFAAVKGRLRARIVNAELASNSAEEKLLLLTRPFSPKALISYVVDSEFAMAYVSKSSLEHWRATADAVHAAAIENLDAISRDVAIEPRAPHPGEGLFAVVQGADGYAAARLLAPRFMARMAEELGPEHFVGAPCRDLLVAWSVDCSVKASLAALVSDYAATKAYPVTDEIFVWSADGVRVANGVELAQHGRG
jgi:hypothetical protein